MNQSSFGATSLYFNTVTHKKGHRGNLQYGHIRTPNALPGVAGGTILTPMVIAESHKPGSTLLVLAGTHGDELEGTQALTRIIQSLSTEDLTAGSVIIIPCANIPAMLNKTRCSPLDNQDMNQVYPGNPMGTPTERMADYILNHLIPMYGVTHVVDIRGGGNSLNTMPYVAYHTHDAVWTADDLSTHVEKRKKLANLINSVDHLVVDHEESQGQTLDSRVEDKRIPFCYIQAAKGYHHADQRPEVIRTVERGILNALVRLDILDRIKIIHNPNTDHPQVKPGHVLITHGPQMIMNSGLLQLMALVGDEVAKDDLLGLITHPQRPELPPIPLRAETPGVVMQLTNQAIVSPGDYLCTVASKHLNS